MAALPERGRLGLTPIGNSHREAVETYHRIASVLDREALGGVAGCTVKREERPVSIRSERRRVVKSPDVRRNELMDAAVGVFHQKGITKATVSDITEAAGVAKGTFYLYFDSKEHLLAALKDRFVDALLERAAALYERVGQDDWWALADTSVQTMVDFMLERRDMIEVFAQEGLTPEARRIFADCENKLRMMFSAGIAAGIEAGAFRVTDPLMAATLLDHAVHGSVEHAILYDEELDRDRLLASARELTRKFLAP
jgi:AcrR family transcriptional regulator